MGTPARTASKGRANSRSNGGNNSRGSSGRVHSQPRTATERLEEKRQQRNQSAKDRYKADQRRKRLGHSGSSNDGSVNKASGLAALSVFEKRQHGSDSSKTDRTTSKRSQLRKGSTGSRGKAHSMEQRSSKGRKAGSSNVHTSTDRSIVAAQYGSVVASYSLCLNDGAEMERALLSEMVGRGLDDWYDANSPKGKQGTSTAAEFAGDVIVVVTPEGQLICVRCNEFQEGVSAGEAILINPNDTRLSLPASHVCNASSLVIERYSRGPDGPRSLSGDNDGDLFGYPDGRVESAIERDAEKFPTVIQQLKEQIESRVEEEKKTHRTKTLKERAVVALVVCCMAVGWLHSAGFISVTDASREIATGAQEKVMGWAYHQTQTPAP